MADVEKEILTRLRLDSKDFQSKVSRTQKDLLKLSAATAGVTTALAIATRAAAQYQDDIIKAARATGTTAEEFSALNRAAELSNVSFDTLRGAMVKLTNPSDQAKETLAELGVTMKDSEGKLKTQSELLGDIADGFTNLQTPQERTRTAFLLFEEAGTQMVNMLKDGSAGLEDMREQAERLGLIVSEEAGQAAEKFNDDLSNIGAALKGLNNSIGQSVIAFVNQTGILEKVRDLIQGVTSWWRNLSEGTREAIVRFASVAGAIASAALALGGIVAIAGPVGGAISFMLGPIGLAITAFGLLATAAVEHWDQIKQSIMPTVQAIESTIDEFAQTFQDAVEAVQGLASDLIPEDLIANFRRFLGLSEGSSEQVSILGTIANVVFKGIATSVRIAITPFQILFDIIKGVVEALVGLGRAVGQVFEGEFEQAADTASAALDRIGRIGTDVTSRLKKAAVDVGDIWSGNFAVTLSQAASAGRKAVKSVGDEVSNTGKKVEEVVQETLTFQSVIDRISSDLVGSFAQWANVSAQQIARTQEITQRDLELKLLRVQEAAEEEAALVETAEDEKIRLLRQGFEDQLEDLRSTERQKVAIIENSAAERLLALNDEFQEAKRLEEERFQAFITSETKKYEFEKELLLQKSADKEQAQLAEEVLEEDFRQYMENLETEHEETMANLADEFRDKERSADSNAKAAAKAAEEAAALSIEEIQRQRDEALVAAEQAKAEKLAEIAEGRAAEEERIERERVESAWQAELAQFQATKAAQIAEATVTGLASAARAFAALAPIPFAGPALGAAAAAVIVATTAKRIQLIQQQEPIKPASLMLAEGGVFGGQQTHTRGGINANFESGEAVIDRERTQRIFDFLDRTTEDSREPVTVVMQFQPGAIQTGDSLISEEMVEQFSEMFAQRMERRGFR